MKVGDVLSVLEQWAPLQYQESYDNAGLITGKRSWQLTAALITLDCTEEVVQEAIDKGANLIIAHHPIVFRGLKKLNGEGYVERTIIKAIKADVAIYAIHTNLDNVSTGVTPKIADLLGLTNQRVLAPKSGTLSKLVTFVPTENTQEVLDALYKAGAGSIGNYDHCSFEVQGKGTFRPNELANPHIGQSNQEEFVSESRIEVVFPSHIHGSVIAALKVAHPYEEVAYYVTALENSNQEVGAGRIGDLAAPMNTQAFMGMVKDKLKVACIRHTTIHANEVKRIAVCGGSGSFLLRKAISSKADVFITADFKYHEFFDADGKIIIADVGHYESEQFTKDLLYSHLIEKITNIAVHLSEVDTNPIKYY
ncbi:MAG: Nif3-like dinuclear metal center hexameric protein [Cyclobacteriaceae bacterium]